MTTLEDIWGEDYESINDSKILDIKYFYKKNKLNEHEIFIVEKKNFFKYLNDDIELVDLYKKLKINFSLLKIWNMDKETLDSLFNFYTGSNQENILHLKYLLSKVLLKLNLIKDNDIKYIENDNFLSICLKYKKIEKIIDELDNLEEEKDKKEFLHEQRNLEVLSGPIQFVFFPDINGQRILLLGENHSVENICKDKLLNYQEVHDWLFGLSLITPTCLDIFVETDIKDRNSVIDLRERKLEDYDCPLNAIRGKFEICNLTKNRREKCIIDNIRYHLVDIRELDMKYEKFIVMLRSLESQNVIFSDEHFFNIEEISKKFFKEIFLYLSGLDENSIGKREYYKILELLLKNYYKKNFLMSLFKSKYKEYIREYEEYRRQYKILINKQLRKIENFNMTHFLESLFNAYFKKGSIEDFTNMLIDINMDVFFLLRYLHTYDSEKMMRGPEKCRTEEFNKSKYSIVYGGAAHTETYKRFFIDYYNVNPIIDILNNSDNQCIKLPYSFDFFGDFSDKEKYTNIYKISENEKDIDISKLNIIKLPYYEVEILGQGAFGTAYKAYDSANKKYVVIKKQLDDFMSNNESRNTEYLKNNCNKYFACFLEDFIKTIDHKRYLYIVTEYLEGYVPLSTIIEELFVGDEQKNKFKTITRNICKGLKLMHSLKLAHLDLKPDNILINPINNEIKFIDFGTSCIKEECSDILGYTPSYVDPFIFLKKKKISEYIFKPKYLERAQQGDLWSFGCIIYEMIIGKTPMMSYINYFYPSFIDEGRMVNDYMHNYNYKKDTNYELVEAVCNKYMGFSLNTLLTEKTRKTFC
uniref:Protein kinase domain-containing protein n=1 Tax=viral metagenome TaxID=1070528 RepID=A0A6C0AFC6_9ZZZZ